LTSVKFGEKSSPTSAAHGRLTNNDLRAAEARKRSNEQQTALTVALVGDTNSYTLQLSKALNALPALNCIFYGPKKRLSGPTKGSVRFKGFKDFRATWTERLYPLQILRQALRDKPAAIHIDYTITEFSSQYLNMLYFPVMVLLLKALRFRVVLTIHDVLSKRILEELFGTRSLRARTIHFGLLCYFQLLSISDTLLVHLNVLRDTLMKEFLIKPNRISLVPFGVAELGPSDVLPYWKDRLGSRQIVLALGVVAPRKGIEYLIEGFSKVAPSHPNSIFVLAGPRDTRRPNYLDTIVRMAKSSLSRDQFLYAGYLDEPVANSLIAMSRVVALSYLYACATTSMLYWIMAHRKPVVASAISTLREELEGYDPMMFVEPRNSAEIATALDRALTDDDLLARAAHFIDLKASNHAWDRIAPSVVTAYMSTSSHFLKADSRDMASRSSV